MIAPVQAATVPDRIRVLPKLRSIWMPRPTVRRPANSTPIPPINNTTIIKFTPAAPEMLASRQGQDTVILCTPPTDKCGRSSRKKLH